MIEIRRLRKMVDRPRGIDDGMYSPALPDKIPVYILQYREWVNGCAPGQIEPKWIDVPTVEAER